MQNERDRKRVFVIYGRNVQARDALTDFLAGLGLRALSFEELVDELAKETKTGAPFVGDVVKEGIKRAQAIVVLFTPDEFAALREGYREDGEREVERWQARQNVLFEAGMALGVDESRTVLVTLGDVSLSSDLLGRHVIKLDDTPKARSALAARLKNLGCAISGDSTEGRFAECVPAKDAPYDELANLEKALQNQLVDGVPLLEMVEDAVRYRKRNSWGGSLRKQAPLDLMNAIERKHPDRAEDAYWWLVVHGVLQFRDIDQWWGPETWRGSEQYVRLSDRGLCLLDRLAARKR